MSSKNVAISEIEETLENIWKSFQSTNKMRASLFNLVIFTEKNKRSLYLDKIAHKVIEKFPSRIIFIQVDDSNADGTIETNVSLINAGKDSNDIVCDLIDILVPKNLAHKAPFIVLAHLLPDLPIYFLYGSNIDPSETIFSQIEPLAQKVIVDSETSKTITDFAKVTLNYYEQKKSHIADLNWERIHSFRNLFATIFKSDDDLKLLKESKAITIHYNAIDNSCFEHHHIQACYFQAWISHCMGWVIKSISKEGESFILEYQGGTAPIHIKLEPCKMEKVLPGRICKIHLETKDADFTIARQPNAPHCLSIEKSLKTRCFLPSVFIIDKETSGQSLIKEIGSAGTNHHYIGTLKQIVSYLPWNQYL